MEEVKKEVSPEMMELSREYSRECMQLGEWGYKAHCLQLDIDATIDRIKDLNKKADLIKIKEANQTTETPKETA